MSRPGRREKYDSKNLPMHGTVHCLVIILNWTVMKMGWAERAHWAVDICHASGWWELHSTGLHAGIIYYSDELISIIHSQPGLFLQNKSKALAKLYSSGQSITDSCGCGVSWAAVIRLSKNIVVSLISAAHAGVCGLFGCGESFKLKFLLTNSYQV